MHEDGFVLCCFFGGRKLSRLSLRFIAASGYPLLARKRTKAV
jgi:hypothetical protein